MGWEENKDRPRCHAKKISQTQRTALKDGRDGLERKQRETRKTSTRQRELHYKTWARWVGTKTKTDQEDKDKHKTDKEKE